MNEVNAITEAELIQWYRRLKKSKYFGKTAHCWEAGEIYLVEENRQMKKNDLNNEINRNQ